MHTDPQFPVAITCLLALWAFFQIPVQLEKSRVARLPEKPTMSTRPTLPFWQEEEADYSGFFAAIPLAGGCILPGC